MAPAKDLTGQRFGRLKALKCVGSNKHNKRLWLCRCSCQSRTEKVVVAGDLINGTTKSCGCFWIESVSKAKTVDITGKHFGSLTVLKRSGKRNNSDSHIFWLCICGCGRTATVDGVHLRSGHTKSCGCQSGNPKIWDSQKQQSSFNSCFALRTKGQRTDQQEAIEEIKANGLIPEWAKKEEPKA